MSTVLSALRSMGALFAGFACLLAVAGSGAMLLQSSSEAPIRELHIEGDFAEIAPEEVADLLRPLLASAASPHDLDYLRQQIEQLPWVAHTRVQRQWPEALRIRIWERRAVARCDDLQLLDSEARRFSPAPEDISPELPLLRAPPGREREVLDSFARLHADLRGSAFEPAALALDARGEWMMTAEQGIELRLGREPPEQRVALIRGPLHRALDGNFARVRYVDLRYSNGFAIGWAASGPDQGAANG